MLVVSANWGIGDGSLRAPPSASAVARFVTDIGRSAVMAGWRDKGRYEPVSSIDVVLAGDTFDLVLSREWLGAARPWQRGAAALAVRERVEGASLAAANRLLAPLFQMARRGIDLPAADRRGRPAFGKTVTVPARLTILEGDLDEGLCRASCHCTDGPAFGLVWEKEGVHVEHGHGGDPAWDRRDGAVPLGASLRVDLLGRFALSPAVAALAPRARRGLIDRFAATDARDWPADHFDAPDVAGHRSSLCRDWQRAVTGWRRGARLMGIGSEVPFDIVDALADHFVDRSRSPDRRDGVGDDHAAGGIAAALAATAVAPPSAAGIATVLLGHPPIAASRPAGRPRVICLGAGRNGTEEPACGAHEVAIPPVDWFRPVAALVPEDEGGDVSAFPPGGTVAEWCGSGARDAARTIRGSGCRIVEAA